MNTVSIGMHQGKVMIRLAKHYSDLPAVVSEVVQNAIDSDATQIAVQIDLPKRSFVVFDNGSGASREKVTEALQSVGDTMKKGNRYGQFGLGLISPISIASAFTFTTCPIPRKNEYTEYTFVSKEIEKQRDVVIPSARMDFTYEPEGRTWWRTRVEATGLVKDRRITSVTIEELAHEVSVKFGEEIRRRPIKITISLKLIDGTKKDIEVIAPEFSGDQLDIYTATGAECGKVVCELYVSRLTKRGRRGEITFGRFDNPSVISGLQFVQCAREILDKDVAKALLSGVIEGRIKCENVRLHADRTRFEDNDALFSLCEVLEKWYKAEGKKIVSEAEESAADDRFQKIGNTVMAFAELFLKQEEFRTVLDQIKIGTIGDGHAQLNKNKILGKDEGSSIATGGRPSDKKESSGNGGGERKDKPKEHPKHSPGITYGPHGKKRTEVKGNSTGLRFEYVEMDGTKIPFTFEPATGTLSFNIIHPNWGLCQETNEYLQEYHVAVLVAALSVEVAKNFDGTVSPEILKFAHESLAHHVFGIKNGAAMIAKFK